MARFLAKHARYYLCARKRIVEHFGTGEERVLQTALDCDWAPDHFSDEEMEEALKVFSFSGQPVEEGTGMPIHPRRNIGILDTVSLQEQHDWSDEERKLVELYLRNHQYFGQKFIEVTPPPAPQPWPGYDSLEAQNVLPAVELTGIDPEIVLAYERENKNRPLIVGELEQLVESAASDEEPEPEAKAPVEEEVIVSA